MIGVFVIIASLLLLNVGLIVLPVFGFIFGAPLRVLGLALNFSPQSRNLSADNEQGAGK